MDSPWPKALYLATKNLHKIEELRAILANSKIKTLPTFSFNEIAPEVDFAETGLSFFENAKIKAIALVDKVPPGCGVLADDSGLAVEALGGAPGVYSARYAGEPSDDAANNLKLIKELTNIQKREAAFVCCLVYIAPDRRIYEFYGHCPGSILHTQRGQGGFGYDPLFYLPQFNASMAELSAEQKNQISHRGIAMQQFANILAQHATA